MHQEAFIVTSTPRHHHRQHLHYHASIMTYCGGVVVCVVTYAFKPLGLWCVLMIIIIIICLSFYLPPSFPVILSLSVSIHFITVIEVNYSYYHYHYHYYYYYFFINITSTHG